LVAEGRATVPWGVLALAATLREGAREKYIKAIQPIITNKPRMLRVAR
jgi:hypothetical protein